MLFNAREFPSANIQTNSGKKFKFFTILEHTGALHYWIFWSTKQTPSEQASWTWTSFFFFILINNTKKESNQLTSAGIQCCSPRILNILEVFNVQSKGKKRSIQNWIGTEQRNKLSACLTLLQRIEAGKRCRIEGILYGSSRIHCPIFPTIDFAIQHGQNTFLTLFPALLIIDCLFVKETWCCPIWSSCPSPSNGEMRARLRLKTTWNQLFCCLASRLLVLVQTSHRIYR